MLSLVSPVAYSNALAGDLSIPHVIVSLRKFMSFLFTINTQVYFL